MSRLCRLQIRQVKKMERDSFVFYRSFYEAIRRQPKKVQADIYNTISDYALNGTEPTQASDAVLSIFLLIKPQIDANNHRYTAGKKGGRPSKTDSNKKEEKTKTVDSEKEGKTETYGFEKEEKTETYGFENRAEKDAFEKPNENENVNENVNVNGNENENGNGNEKPKTITASTVVAAYHRLCPSFPAVKVISDKRKKAIHARLNSGYTLADFEQAFTKAEHSRFLRGGNKNNWQADFDWLMKDGNLPKVLEGKYDDDSGADYGRGEEDRYSGTVL